MSGVTVAEQQQFSESVWSDLVGWLGDTAEAFSQSTATGAQAWNQLGDAYEHVINTAMQRADQYAVQAFNEGRPENAAYWQKFVNQYQQLLAEKQVMQIDKWVQSVHLDSLSKIVKPLDIAADVAQGAAALQEAVDTGDGDAFANFLMGFAASTIIATGLSWLLAAALGASTWPALLAIGLIAGLAATFGGDAFKDWAQKQGITHAVGDYFTAAIGWFQRRDPLTLDLDGDGIESTGVNTNDPILFDHDGDGIKNATGWISSDDGLLVLDRNGNGTIDSGRELFGDSTQLPNGQNAEDGFAALAAEDTNGDGAVTAADARFDQLRVWRDLNQDGVSQSGELFTLQQLGIISINVDAVEHNQPLANGNQIADLGTYIRSDGTEGTVGETHGSADVDLADDPFYREFPDQIPLAPGVDELPNAMGSGLVRDLWEAASLSTNLRGVLAQFSAATTRAEQLALLDQLLLEWAKTAGMDSMEQRANEDNYGLRWQQIGSAENHWTGFMHAAPGGGTTGDSGGNRGSMMTPEEMQSRVEWEMTLARTRNLFTVLEAFNGRYFFALPDDSFAGARSGIATFSMADPDEPPSGGGGVVTYPVLQLRVAQPQLDALDASYEALRESVYNGLVLQTRLEPLINMIELVSGPDGSGTTLDFQDLEGELQARIQQNAFDGMADLIELTRGLARPLAGSAWNGWQLIDQNIRSLPSTPELEVLYAQFGVQIASGTGALNGNGRSNVLLGSASGESISGDAGNDALIAGAGNDNLYGGEGSDTLLGGAGNDGLHGGSGDDVLEGGTGNDHMRGEVGNDLYVFRRGDGQDTIDNYDTTADRLDVLRMGPGIGVHDVQLTMSGSSLVVAIRGTTDRVTINGFFDSDNRAINGIALADGEYWDLEVLKAKVQSGTSGNDHLVAHDSGSALYGQNGDDLLEGGAGEDLIYDLWGANVARGGAGDDSIHAMGTIEGGTGNDTLTGTGGSTTYLFNVGDGQDTINEIGFASNPDTLSFGAGIAPTSITLVRSGNDLTFKISETDQVTVKGWFSDPGWYGIERVQFADGTLWTTAQMQALVPQLYVASESGETIQGWDGIDIIDGAGGNDTINGGGGNDQLSGGDGNDTLNAGTGNDVLTGGAGNDTLNGDTGDDVLEGGDGDDTFYDLWGANVARGAAGNDTINTYGTIEGGTGNDTLTGTGGSNTYLFNVGDGQDTITEIGYASNPDTLSFGAGIAPSAITLVRSGNDLTFRINETDQVTVKHWFTDPGWYGIEQVQFADGTTWNTAAMQALVPQAYVATEAGETIIGWEGIDIIDGAGGNDTINGGGGNDQLAGGDGNDTLNAGTGNDVLMGGAGNDTLNGDTGDDVLEGGDGDDTFYDLWGANVARGGAGNDTINTYGTIEGGTGNDTLTGTGGSNTYLFNVGDGQDTITEIGYASNPDTLVFGAGITPAAVSLVRFGNDLTFRVSETDQVKVKNWFTDPGWYGIEQVQFADGTTWNTAAMQALVQVMYVGTESGETIQGWDGIDLIDGAGGNDTINGAGGNDQLTGGEGNDTLNLGVGNDTAFGGAGNDTLNGESGDDVMEGGDGDDTFYDLWGANIARGGAGNDTINTLGTIEGGTGNDTITGTGGSNTYLFNVGDGQDTINEIGYASNPDTLSLGAGIAPADVTLVRSGNDLIFRISETDQVKVKNWFTDPGWYAIERVQFADGTLWMTAQIQAQVPQLYVASASGETIQGWDGIDIIDGAGGNDTINGAGGNDQLAGGDGNDTLNAGTGNDVLMGGAGNDTLNGDSGDDVMEGGDGDDTFYDLWGANIARGGAGNDTINTLGTIEGGTGNDTITGTGGSNTYLFNVGDGQDTITEMGFASNPDTLSFGAGIAPADVTLVRSGNDLIFRISETDQVKVKNWFTDPGWYAIERVQFADGTLWTTTQLQALVPQLYVATESGETILGWDGIDIIDGAGGNDTINGAGGNDQLTGGEGNDTLNLGVGNDTAFGGAGNDTLNGESGDDVMEGGDGDDTFYDLWGANIARGGAGNDTINTLGTIEGGTGNDTLTGTGGSNTYLFNVGDGQDTINEIGYASNPDTLSFGAGIAPANITLVRSGNDLTFRVSETDQVKVKNWFTDVGWYGVERVQFADGTLWTMTQIMAQVPAQYVASESGETINGWDGIDVIDGAGGNDTVNGYLGNDFLSGGAGADQLIGGNGTNGNDLMQGGADADTLSDPTGNNLFDGGDGNDTLTGGHGSSARDLFIGGAGNDTITTGNGADVLVFARTDGADTVLASTGGGDTLSLGGGIAYADLSFRKNGNDLILDAGSGDQITFQNWYASTNNRSVVNLQMVAEAMSGFAAGGSDPLLDNSIEQFNFLGLVGRFDQARAADPGLTSWALSNALLDFHTSGSDSAAYGGDLAYQHGLNRSLAGIGMAPAQAVLNDSQFATQAQTLHPLATLQTGAVRLA